ncbi:MAG: 6,7-dimethyl-8-ribityllumazine synthase [Candidatus Gracilibacteria bacterium]|jgi:6,7-dimethyl-8-ribityllumazine synthase
MKTSQSKAKLNGKPFKIAIILARYNDDLGSELLENTTATLLKNGVIAKNIDVIRVPGALEIPLAAQMIAQNKSHQAIIALGIVIKGETAHFEHVSQQSHNGLMQVSLEQKIPVIFGILTVNNLKQATDRISKTKLNKGQEYAEAAIEMAQLLQKLQ